MFFTVVGVITVILVALAYIPEILKWISNLFKIDD